MKKMSFWALLSCLMITAACSDSNDLPGKGDPGSSDNLNVNVSLKLPGTDIVSYADIATNEEIKVDSLNIYMFSKENDSSTDFTLQKVLVQGEDFSTLSSSVGVDISFKVSGADDKHLYFIANDTEGIASLAATDIRNTTEDEFKALLTDAVPQVPSLLMTAYQSVAKAALETAVTDGTPVALGDVELTRVASRLDILNYEKTLAIDSVQLLNTPSASFIYNVVDGTTWTFAGVPSPVALVNLPVKKIDDALRYVPGSASLASEEQGDSLSLKGLYYPYEGLTTNDSKSLTLKIWGRLNATDQTNGSLAVYEVPLTETTAASADPSAQRILRNHRYIVRINNAISGTMSATFTIKDWTVADGDTVTQPIDAGLLKVTSTALNISKVLEVPATFSASAADSTYTFAVEASTAWTFGFNGSETADWVTIDAGTIVMNTDTGIGESFTLKINKNETTEAREVRIKVVSSADPELFYIFKISQAQP